MSKTDKEDEEVYGDDYDTYEREKEFVQDVATKHNVVMFSKTWCPFCKKLKALFEANKIRYNALELDTHSNGPNIQDALEELTGSKRPVPAVYICKKFRGGYNEIYSAWANGTLEEWLQCKETDFTFDLLVLGGGSGGIAAAKEAAKLGKKVAIVDYVAPTPKGTTWGLGGTCANVGCIPKKLMHRAALIYHDIKDAESFGWEVEPPETHNWESMIEKIQEHIDSLNWEYKKQLRELGIVYHQGKGMLKDRHTVEVIGKEGKKTELQGSTILIAVGGRPMYLDAVGAEKCCITSDDLFSLKSNPGRTLVIGGGHIAVECASFLNVFGCEVKLMARKNLLKRMDQDFVKRITRHLEAHGIEINYDAFAIKFYKPKYQNKIFVEGMDGQGDKFCEEFDTVITALGRWPNTECIGLMTVGVQLDEHTKKVIVNRRDQTTVSNIFAIGDCRYGTPDLTPISKKAGKLLARRLFGMSDVFFDYKLIPNTIYTPLEYSFVGESEEHAYDIHGDAIEIYHNIFQPYESVLSNRFDSRSYVKIICQKVPSEGEKIIGIHIYGPNASEIIQGYALAVKMGATKEQLDSLVGIHPTCAEFLTNLCITKRSGEDIEQIVC
ncbi:thioredoxin reductase 1, cytoplasmic-like isoform X1 [Cimex lectularius]|uniref:thioredoxin-disulfide reductase (NADPH) n=1 Tax=Cimex lectularius TaxID=79782 RepID=A0A8I6S4F8_CIMLE|nr:thioredoxin reductase 1, cytoplasmic-like isoform X1 [Cimex lectularius]